MNNNNTPNTWEELFKEADRLAHLTAIGQFLSDFPDDKSPEDIRELLVDGDDSVLVWEPFSYDDAEHIDELIENLYLVVRADLVSVVEHARRIAEAK